MPVHYSLISLEILLEPRKEKIGSPYLMDRQYLNPWDWWNSLYATSDITVVI
jgi:hypothetical protein